MNRLIRNSLIALGLTAGIASSAPAQFLPSPFGLPTIPYRYFASQVYVNNLGMNYSLNYYRTSPMGYSYTYMPSMIPNPVYESQARAMRQARQQMDIPFPAAKTVNAPVENTVAARGESATRELRLDRLSEESFNGLPTAFKTAIVSPKHEDITNGKSLNDILTTTFDLEKKFGRSGGSYLAPEVTSSIRFAGNAHADLSNWVRLGEIDFPEVFRTEEYATPRAWLKNDFGLIVANLTVGKTPDSSLYQALVTAGRTIRRTFDERKPGLSPDDRKTGEQFLAKYDAVANIVRSPAAVELCSVEFSTMGLGTVELLEHMSKFKLQFAAAPKGQDAAYEMLHRAISTYAISLMDQRR